MENIGHKKQDMVIETICPTKYKAHLLVVYCLSDLIAVPKSDHSSRGKKFLMHDQKNLDARISRGVEHVLKFFQSMWRRRAETSARIADPF